MGFNSAFKGLIRDVYNYFDVHVTAHRFEFLIIKPTRCTNYSILFLEMKLYMFRTIPLSIIRSFSLYTHQWYMSYWFADSLWAGSSWIWFSSDRTKPVPSWSWHT